MNLKLIFLLLVVVLTLSATLAQDYDSWEEEKEEESPNYNNNNDVEGQNEEKKEDEDSPNYDNNNDEGHGNGNGGEINEIEEIIGIGDDEAGGPEKPVLAALTSQQIEEVEELEENADVDDDGNEAGDSSVFEEGDMKVSSTEPVGFGYAGIVDRKWPKGIVPYEFAYHGFTRREKEMIYAGMKYIARYIHFKGNEAGCFADLGWKEGRRDVNLISGCFNKNGIITVAHELMHSLGIIHEQSRMDRNRYVTVLPQNIKKGQEHNFDNKQQLTNTYGLPYDYKSIMHYGNYAFSKNGKPTILVNSNRSYKLGDRDRFSSLDGKKINNMYNHCR